MAEYQVECLSFKEVDALKSLYSDLPLSDFRFTKETHSHTLHLMPMVLSKLKEAMQVVNETCEPLMASANNILDRTNDYAHIYCFIEFVYALPPLNQTLAHREISGDGVLWAGCTLLKLLGLEEKHKLFSYLNHLLYTREIELVQESFDSLSDETDGVFIVSGYVKHTSEAIYDYISSIVPSEKPQGMFSVPEKIDQV